MARNKYVKFCDKNELNSGVMREMLITGNAKESLIAIRAYKKMLLDKAQACNDLHEMIVTDKHLEQQENL